MNIIDIITSHGEARSEIKENDQLLIEGSDSLNGIYVILSGVKAIEGNIVILQQNHKYYISGIKCKMTGEELRCEAETLKLSIQHRLIEQAEFWKWIVEKWKEDMQKIQRHGREDDREHRG
jgi:hypothetical protein